MHRRLRAPLQAQAVEGFDNILRQLQQVHKDEVVERLADRIPVGFICGQEFLLPQHRKLIVGQFQLSFGKFAGINHDKVRKAGDCQTRPAVMLPTSQSTRN